MADRKDLKTDVPVLIKLSPTFSQYVVFDSAIEEIMSIAQSHGVSGFIATNTTPDRENLKTPDEVLTRIGAGGLSGAPLTLRTTRLIKYLYEKTQGDVPIIAVGGIDSAEAGLCQHSSRRFSGAIIYRPGISRPRCCEKNQQRPRASLTAGRLFVDKRCNRGR